MSVHLYFSLIPEALIASMLTPEQFGQYYATGRHYKTKGQAAFFEVDPSFRHEYFPIEEGIARCVPHPDGAPKNSVYISTYRVIEHVPLSAIGLLHLVTAYGQTLAIERSRSLEPRTKERCHLYQDLAPINSLAVSSLEPKEYYEKLVTAPSKLIRFPGLAFVDLGLGELADNPETGSLHDLPYPYTHHLRESLLELGGEKRTKLVARVQTPEFLYRMVRTGFYVGSGPDIALYPLPSHEELRRDHWHWWRSANL
jgi:hypothetical protein